MTKPSTSIREFILRHVVALGVVWALVLVVAAVTNSLPLTEDFAICVIVGTGFGFVSVAAAWLALGPMEWSFRLPGSTALAAASMVVTIFMFALFQSPVGDLVCPMFIGAAVQFCILQIPLWALRALHGLRMVDVADLGGEHGDSRLQFKLSQMLLGMTLIAIVLGVGRWLHMLVEWMTPRHGGERMAVFFALYVGFNLLLAWPMIWALLSPRQPFVRVFLAATLAALVTLIEHPVFVGVLGPGGGALFFWLLNVPYLLCMSAHLVVTRICGYRLVRSSRVSLADSVKTQS